MRIEQITLQEIQLPLREPFQISSGIESVRRIFLLHFRTAGGLESWSECVAGATPNYSPETIDTAWMTIKTWLAPRVLHREIKGASAVSELLAKDIRGHRMARAALEMACWELEAQELSQPLAKLLGGVREKIGTGISLGIQDSPEKLAEKVGEALRLGYRKVKMKIKPGMDLAFVREVRERVGREAPLMVDANNAYTLEDIETLHALDTFNLMMIEQPLRWDDIFDHAALQQKLRTPICLDESITSADKAREMIALKSGRIVNIKPGRVGGFSESIRIHNLCRDSGIPVWCGGMLESGVGRAYNVALASLPNFTLPADLSPSARYWEKDIVTPEWEMNGEGMVSVPLTKSGMGVTVHVDRVDNLTVRKETLT